MDELLIVLFVIVAYSVKGLAVLALAYFGARMAIRHERRPSK
jgi:hypothetical protein